MRNKKGAGTIELLIVIALLGSLAVGIFGQYGGVTSGTANDIDNKIIEAIDLSAINDAIGK